MDYRDRTAPVIEAYPTALSVEAGTPVEMCCSATVGTVAVEVARVGGERRIVWTRAAVATQRQPVPPDASSNGCGWEVTFQVDTGRDWASGYYEVVLRGRDVVTGLLTESYAFFVVRPSGAPERRGDRLLLVLATNTYNAYNDWGGLNLYDGGVRASFQRPWAPGLLR